MKNASVIYSLILIVIVVTSYGCYRQAIDKRVTISLDWKTEKKYSRGSEKSISFVINFRNGTDSITALILRGSIIRSDTPLREKLVKKGWLVEDVRIEARYENNSYISDTLWNAGPLTMEMPLILRVKPGHEEKITLWPPGDIRKIFPIPEGKQFEVSAILMPNNPKLFDINDVYLYTTDRLKAGEKIFTDTIYTPWIKME